jgi:hypothetical protein
MIVYLRQNELRQLQEVGGSAMIPVMASPRPLPGFIAFNASGLAPAAASVGEAIDPSQMELPLNQDVVKNGEAKENSAS